MSDKIPYSFQQKLKYRPYLSLRFSSKWLDSQMLYLKQDCELTNILIEEWLTSRRESSSLFWDRKGYISLPISHQKEAFFHLMRYLLTRKKSLNIWHRYIGLNKDLLYYQFNTRQICFVSLGLKYKCLSTSTNFGRYLP